MGGFSVTGSGFTAKGINPFFTNNAGEACCARWTAAAHCCRARIHGAKNRLALSYGKTVDDGNGLGSAADYESRGIAYFRTINDNLKLVAELNRYRIDGRDGTALDEDTDTVAPRRRTELVIPLLSKDPAATQVG